jgi:hypothetical protein
MAIADRHIDQPNDRRVGGFVEIGDLFVHAVDRKNILDQIVGPKRKEIHFFCQHIARQCRGRDLDGPDMNILLNASPFSFGHGFVQDHPGSTLHRPRNHRVHDLCPMSAGGESRGAVF